MSPSQIALLRGVMPSGKNRVPMAQLREVLTADGFEQVRTYIQSGNVVLRTGLSATATASRIHDLIKAQIGPDLTVVVRTAAQLQEILDGNPLKESHDRSRQFFVIFAEPPTADRIEQLRARDFGAEKLHLDTMSAVLFVPGPYGRGTLSANFLERQLGIAATMRNANTLDKLIAMAA